MALLGVLLPLWGQETRNSPINVNLIIDGSQALSGVKDDVVSWVSQSIIDRTLINGDRITVWSAGQSAKVIFSETIKSAADKDAVKKSIQAIGAGTGAGGSSSGADFSGALKEASSRQDSNLSYTLLITASPYALSAILSSPQASLLKYSRVEEFSGWRVLIIALNIDSKVRNAAAAFFNS